MEPLKLPARSPNLNSVAERWVKSAKVETLSRLVLFSQEALRRALGEHLDHHHKERNHQSFGKRLLFPEPAFTQTQGKIVCNERLGGLLKFYSRKAA